MILWQLEGDGWICNWAHAMAWVSKQMHLKLKSLRQSDSSHTENHLKLQDHKVFHRSGPNLKMQYVHLTTTTTEATAPKSTPTLLNVSSPDAKRERDPYNKVFEFVYFNACHWQTHTWWKSIKLKQLAANPGKNALHTSAQVKINCYTKGRLQNCYTDGADRNSACGWNWWRTLLDSLFPQNDTDMSPFTNHH